MIDYLQLFDDYAVDYALEGKNFGNNFIGIHCPWCNDSSYHGGVPKDGSEKFSVGVVAPIVYVLHCPLFCIPRILIPYCNHMMRGLRYTAKTAKLLAVQIK